MHGIIEAEHDLVKLTSGDVQQYCAKSTKPLPFLALRQRLPTPTGTNLRIFGAKICNARILQSIIGFPLKWRRMS
jgi:hypothetical protein